MEYANSIAVHQIEDLGGGLDGDVVLQTTGAVLQQIGNGELW